MRKYRNTLAHLEAFCEQRGLEDLGEINIEILGSFRAARGIALISGAKELELLRQFFRFCQVRHWIAETPAEELKAPRNLKPNEVEPYTDSEIEAMLEACGRFGNRVSRCDTPACALAM